MRCGVENEYLVSHGLSPDLFDPLSLTVRQRFLQNYRRYALPLLMGYERRNRSVLLRNGGEFYPDMGYVLEYASPECETIRELVAVEKAGELLVPMLMSEEMELRWFLFAKTSARPALNGMLASWGSHENYQVSSELHGLVTSEGTSRHVILEAHLVSRILFCGAGFVRPEIEEPRLGFEISPRAMFVDVRIGQSTVDRRAIVNTRDEYELLARTEREVKRLHLVCGDMNRSEWSLYLKYGTTALLLAYLEMEGADRERLAQSVFINRHAVTILRNISRSFDPDMRGRFYGHGIFVERRILAELKKYAEALSEQIPETKDILALWEEAIDAVADPHHLSPFAEARLDWCVKRRIIEGYIGAPIERLFDVVVTHAEAQRLLSLDLSYHKIGQGDLSRHLTEQGDLLRFLTESEVACALESPPLGRAAKRVKVLEYLIEKGYYPCIDAVGWANLVFSNPFLQRQDKVPHVISFDGQSLESILLDIETFIGSFSNA